MQVTLTGSAHRSTGLLPGGDSSAAMSLAALVISSPGSSLMTAVADHPSGADLAEPDRELDVAVVPRSQSQVMVQRFIGPLALPPAPVRCQPAEEFHQVIEPGRIVGRYTQASIQAGYPQAHPRIPDLALRTEFNVAEPQVALITDRCRIHGQHADTTRTRTEIRAGNHPRGCTQPRRILEQKRNPLTQGLESVVCDLPDDSGDSTAIMDWKDGKIVGLEVLTASSVLHARPGPAPQPLARQELAIRN